MIACFEADPNFRGQPQTELKLQIFLYMQQAGVSNAA